MKLEFATPNIDNVTVEPEQTVELGEAVAVTINSGRPVNTVLTIESQPLLAVRISI